MRFRPKLRRFYLFFFFFIFLPLAVGCFFAIGFINQSYLDAKGEKLRTGASTIAAQAVQAILRGQDFGQSELQELSDLTGFRIALLDRQGKLISASGSQANNPSLDYSFFQDVRSAMAGNQDMLQGADFLSNEQELFVSVPLKIDGDVRGILRISRSLDSLLSDERPLYFILFLMLLLALASAFLFTRLLLNRMYRPLYELEQGARRFARGDLKFRLLSDPEDELAPLSRILNQMASQLDERIQAALSQRNEMNAVFAAMREGVVVINREFRVLRANQAALEMLGTVKREVEGKSLEEVVRNIDLQNFVRTILSDNLTRETEIFLHENKEINVQVYSSFISDSESGEPALMIVINDVTQLKQLEKVRTDFVANVSHELKTPITSIQGFVETLLDGAMHNPEENQRFLEIIKRQTERLNTIFNDLLMLAGLEMEPGSREITFERVKVKDLVSSVLLVAQAKADKKRIRFDLSGVDEREIYANASLLEQALLNLVDNAIKYGPDDSVINISTGYADSRLRISVIDKGLGIDPVQQKRIFERFYRVDQARSREVGGTGLGLSIVKHIALLHGGTVEVESVPGKGSTFSIIIPD